jgi:hypothetical protein
MRTKTKAELEAENARLEKQLAGIEMRLVETITSSGDPYAAMQFLERRWPQRWAPTCRVCLLGREPEFFDA